MTYQIAVDGPAGAGKSTIAKAVAKKLNFIYVDTGAMYRALGLFCLRDGIDLLNEADVSKHCELADVKIRYEEGNQVVYLNGENVNGLIRTNEVGDAASKVSAYKDVRAMMVKLQQKLAESESVIMDGRDIGSTVLPNANLKIYLDASVEERARRRCLERKEKGLEADMESIISEIKDRDYRDMHRDVTPLVCVPDAVKIDSSDMTPDEVIAKIMELFSERK